MQDIFPKYHQDQLQEYQKELSIIASLSNLFSDNTAPMIYYRATENIYCRAFGATNVSRTDCTADALFDLKIGVGIKTFLDIPGGSYQKIAEFNQQAPLYKGLSGLTLIKQIAELRNDRIDFTVRNYGLKGMIYHCILRSQSGEIKIYEEEMHRVDIEHITVLDQEPTKCTFTDGIETYEFYYSKSTLFKRFCFEQPLLSFSVSILSDPMEALSKLVNDSNLTESGENHSNFPSILIPLYSENDKAGKFVGQSSGLNQWHARGRKRDPNEIYIPFPVRIKKENPVFFPERFIPWTMKLPNGSSLMMAVCQENGKALMSNPNKALGEWLLREVLRVPERHVVTYDDLLRIGVDSIIIRKHPDGTYDCDFASNDQ